MMLRAQHYSHVPAVRRCHAASLSSMKEAKHRAHLGKSGWRWAKGKGRVHVRMVKRSSIAWFFLFTISLLLPPMCIFVMAV